MYLLALWLQRLRHGNASPTRIAPQYQNHVKMICPKCEHHMKIGVQVWVPSPRMWKQHEHITSHIWTYCDSVKSQYFRACFILFHVMFICFGPGPRPQITWTRYDYQINITCCDSMTFLHYVHVLFCIIHKLVSRLLGSGPRPGLHTSYYTHTACHNTFIRCSYVCKHVCSTFSIRSIFATFWASFRESFVCLMFSVRAIFGC